jgi:hypothetical protein
MANLLSTLANIAQIFSAFWVLVFGPKTIVDAIKAVLNSRKLSVHFSLSPLQISVAVAIIILISSSILWVSLKLFAPAQAGHSTQVTTTIVTQIPDPYPPFKGTLVISDSLSNNNQGDGWRTYIDTLSSCNFINGHYQIVETRTAYYADCQSTPYFDNFTAEVKLQIVRGDCGGIIFRANPALTQFYLFRICRDSSYTMLRYVDNTNASAVTLSNGSNAGIQTGPGATNVIAVVANSGQISLYVNNQLLKVVTDNTYTDGHIALFAQSEGNTTEVDFRDLKVWSW